MDRIELYGTSGWFETEHGCTSCVGIHTDGPAGEVVLLDLGTGVRRMRPESVHGRPLIIILSHLHLDHCQGLHLLPMFSPSSLTIVVHEALLPSLQVLFDAPFTKPRHALGYPVRLIGLSDSTRQIGGVEVTTRALVHNTPVLGARLSFGGTTLAYCVDTRACEGLLELSAGIDTLIIETAPPPGRAGNGHHLTLPELKAFLSRCDAKRAVITHFGARKFESQAAREALVAELRGSHSALVTAYDGLRLELRP